MYKNCTVAIIGSEINTNVFVLDPENKEQILCFTVRDGDIKVADRGVLKKTVQEQLSIETCDHSAGGLVELLSFLGEDKGAQQ
jgi:hypothetical protein